MVIEQNYSWFWLRIVNPSRADHLDMFSKLLTLYFIVIVHRIHLLIHQESSERDLNGKLTIKATFKRNEQLEKGRDC